MPDIITEFFNWLSTGKIGDVPVIYVLFLVGAIIFIFYLLITRKAKVKKYKPIILKKEIKKEIQIQYKYFSSSVQKPIYSGLIKVGYAIGYMPITWNIRTKRFESIFKRKPDDINKLEKVSKEVYNKKFKELSDDQKKGVRDVIKEESIENYPTITDDGKVKISRGKIEIAEDMPLFLYCFKVCSDDILNKIFAKLFGLGIKYFFIEEKSVTIKDDSIQFDSGLQRQFFFGHFIFSTIGRNIIDNTSFRIDRENILQETANQIPRTVFFDTELAKRIAQTREIFKLEQEKHKAVKESQE